MEITNQLCRLCFNTNEQTINIFNSTGIELNIANILSKHFLFHQTIGFDNLPQEICRECWIETEKFEKFHNLSEIAYQNYINVNPVLINDDNSGDIKNFTLNIEQINNTITTTANTTTDLQNNDDSNENEILIEDLKSDIQKCEFSIEAPDIQSIFFQNNHWDDNKVQNDNSTHKNADEESQDNDDDDDKEFILKPQTSPKYKVKPTKRGKKKIVNKSNGIATKRKYKRRCENGVNQEELPIISTTKYSLLEKQQQREKEDVQIREYFKMECELCIFKFETYNDAKTHYRIQHNVKGYIICCSKKFTRRGRVLEHILQHTNPEFYKCEICNKTYAEKSTLKYHIETHRMPNEAERPYKCDKCIECFSKPFQLSQHFKLRHDIKQYACEECGKIFHSKTNLSAHIRSIHNQVFTQICDICAKVFKSAQTLEYHRRQLHFADNQEPKVQCNICGSWLKHAVSLHKHLLRHNDVAQKCPHCDKQAPNSDALKSHIRTVHTERLHVCKLCNKAFKKPVALKEHIASHTGESLYTCPHCSRTFNSSANMHSHRKKAHPVEWLENRGKRILSYK